MKVDCKRKDNTVDITVKFSANEIAQAIDKKYKKISREYKFPGFRPGHVPRPVVDNLFGKDGVKAQVTDELVNSSTPLAIDDANIFPCGQADFGEKELALVKDGKPYKYEFKIEVEPEFELEDYKPVSITMPPAEPSEDEVDAQIDQFRQNYFSYSDAPASAKAEDDSTLNLKIKATDDKGEEIETLTNDSLSYHLGSKFLPESFEKKLVGCKKGDKKSFKIAMPKEPTVYTTSLVDRTKNLNFDIEVNSIQNKVLPKVDDEWVKQNVGFENVAEFRKQISEQIAREKVNMAPVLKENKALAELAKRLKGEPSDALCQKKEAELLQDFFGQLQQSGMTFDAYLAQAGIDSDKFKEDVKKQAHDVAAQDLALDALARNLKLKVTEDELIAEFKHGDPDNWEKLYKEWRERGELHKLRAAILRMKAAKELVENADVKVGKDDNKKKQPAKKTTAKKNDTNKKAGTKTQSKKTVKKAAEKKSEDKKAADSKK